MNRDCSLGRETQGVRCTLCTFGRQSVHRVRPTHYKSPNEQSEMNQHDAWRVRATPMPLLLLAMLGVCGASLAADPGRLFYTPDQRAQLEAARARNITQLKQATPDTGAPPPVRYDGVVIRSDGKTTRWVDGQPQTGASGVAGLKPGQIRADGRVYEPYQVLRPSPAEPVAEEPTP